MCCCRGPSCGCCRGCKQSRPCTRRSESFVWTNDGLCLCAQPNAGFSSVHGGGSAYAALSPDGSQRAWMRRSVSTVMLDELLPPDSSHRSAILRLLANWWHKDMKPNNVAF